MDSSAAFRTGATSSPKQRGSLARQPRPSPRLSSMSYARSARAVSTRRCQRAATTLHRLSTSRASSPSSRAPTTLPSAGSPPPLAALDSHCSPRPYVDCPRLLRYRTDARWSALRRRTITTRRAPSGRRLTVPISRPPPLAATGIFGLTCRTATGITEPTVRCVVYIHSFPTTSRTQEGGFSA